MVCPLASSIHGLMLIRSTMQGFFVPQKNVFSFASIQFLTVSVQHLPFEWRLISRAIQVVLPFFALYSACAHGQSFRLGYSNVECTHSPSSQCILRLTMSNLQPYLLLSQGNALARETLLIDYVS